MWNSLCVAAMTGDLHWTPESLRAGPFLEHPAGAARYLNGIATRPLPEYAPSAFEIVGFDCFKFFGRFGAVILQHWAPEWILYEIRRASSYPGGTQVGLWANYETVAGPGPMGPPWDKVQTVLWQICTQHLLAGTDGQPVNLIYPRTPGWLVVDIRKPDLADAYVAGLEWILGAYYSRNPPNFVFFDCHDPRRWFPPTVPNAPAFSEEEYVEGWTRLDLRMHRAGVEWAHNPGDDAYPTLGARVHEHALREHRGVDVLAAWIGKALARNPAYLGIGSEVGELPGNPSTWFSAVRNKVGPHREDLVYLQTARTGRAFRIFECSSTA